MVNEDVFNNPKWKERIKSAFDFLDRKKEGKISVDLIMNILAGRDVALKMNASEDQMKRLMDVISTILSEMEFQPGTAIYFDNYIKGVAILGKNELERQSKNETTLARLASDALFDVIDENHDGSISLEEWTAYGKVVGYDDDACKATFNVCDLNGDGKLSPDEFALKRMQYWYSLDEDAENLFGNTYK